jgi:TolA-binding protein
MKRQILSWVHTKTRPFRFWLFNFLFWEFVNGEVDSQSDDLQQQLDDLEKRLDEFETEHPDAQQFKDLEGKVDDLEGKVDDLEGKVDDLEGKVDDLEGKVETLEDQVDEGERSSKMAITGKKLGFKVGDLVHTGAFPGIIISDVGTTAPCCEIFGIEQEMGSVYAHDLKPLPPAEFVALAQQFGHGRDGFQVWSEKSLKALQAAGIKVEKR